jgi:hypothetical protein
MFMHVLQLLVLRERERERERIWNVLGFCRDDYQPRAQVSNHGRACSQGVL